MKYKHITALLLAATLLCGCGAVQNAFAFATHPEPNGMEIMKAMNIGWNLGNSFDAPGGETAWGNPVTREELLIKVKKLGFDTIRIPISWGRHVSAAPDYTIDPKYMERVDTVVHQALDAGLYVIIDAHHDNDIYTPTPENMDHAKEYLDAIWRQIAEHFRDDDHHLIFQTMNEPRVEGESYEWELVTTKKSHQEIIGVVNELNQTALNAIRSTGGKNTDRFVIVSAYAGKTGSAANAYFRMPEDTVEGRLILSVHIYTPYNLCLNLDKKYHTFSAQEMKEVDSLMTTIQMSFLKRGIPVVIDEMGCTNKSNPEDRYAWAKTFIEAADAYGIPCILWDNGSINGSGDNFALINRITMELYPESECVYHGLMDGHKK